MNIYNNSNSQTMTGSYTTLTNFSASDASLSGWSYANDVLTAGVSSGGTYLATFSVSFNGTQTTNYLLGISLENDDPDGSTNPTNSLLGRYIGSNNDIGNAVCTGIIDIAASETIRLKANAASDITVIDANLTLLKLDGAIANPYASMDINNNSNTITLPRNVWTIEDNFTDAIRNSSFWNFSAANDNLTPINLSAGVYLANYYLSVGVPSGSNQKFDAKLAIFNNGSQIRDLTIDRALERKESGNTDQGSASGTALIVIDSDTDELTLELDNTSSNNDIDAIVQYANLNLFRIETINDGVLPIVLSAFTAIQTEADFAQINWTTQSESNISGYNIYRNIENNNDTSEKINHELILGTNTSNEQNYKFLDNSVETAEYFYWLESVELSGNTELFGPISLIIQLQPDNPSPPEIPEKYGLFKNYPNPFNPQTEIKFALEESGNAELSVYNMKGKKIATLYDRFAEANEFIYSEWDGKDYSGSNVASGVYMYKLKTPNKEYTKKMLLVK